MEWHWQQCRRVTEILAMRLYSSGQCAALRIQKTFWCMLDVQLLQLQINQIGDSYYELPSKSFTSVLCHYRFFGDHIAVQCWVHISDKYSAAIQKFQPFWPHIESSRIIWILIESYRIIKIPFLLKIKDRPEHWHLDEQLWALGPGATAITHVAMAKLEQEARSRVWQNAKLVHHLSMSIQVFPCLSTNSHTGYKRIQQLQCLIGRKLAAQSLRECCMVLQIKASLSVASCSERSLVYKVVTTVYCKVHSFIEGAVGGWRVTLYTSCRPAATIHF